MAVAEQVAASAAEMLLEEVLTWLITDVTAHAFTPQKALEILDLERVGVGEKTLKGICVCFTGHLRHVNPKP